MLPVSDATLQLLEVFRVTPPFLPPAKLHVGDIWVMNADLDEGEMEWEKCGRLSAVQHCPGPTQLQLEIMLGKRWDFIIAGNPLFLHLIVACDPIHSRRLTLRGNVHLAMDDGVELTLVLVKSNLAIPPG